MADLTLWFWTDDPERAALAQDAGVARIGLDIERRGKAERQLGRNAWLSPHELSALPGLRARLNHAALFLRTNPVHPGLQDEIETALAQGVDILMLPNFTTLDEVAETAAIIAGRAAFVPLVERVAALPLITGFPALGIAEFHVGLNDLAYDLGVTDQLGLLLSPEIEAAAALGRQAGLRFGIGAVARVGDDRLPVPADLVLARLVQLGASGVLLARSFWQGMDIDDASVNVAVGALKRRFRHWTAAGAAELDQARLDFVTHVADPGTARA